MMRIALAAVLALAATAATAGPATDVVRTFYDNPDAVSDPTQRHRFAGDALDVIEANEANDEQPCLDFSIAYDAQDWDEAEIARTLSFDEGQSGDEANVTASFSLFGARRKVDWSLQRIDDEWKVVDVAGEGWRLSEFDCDG